MEAVALGSDAGGGHFAWIDVYQADVACVVHRQPRGRPPTNKAWDTAVGRWVPLYPAGLCVSRRVESAEVFVAVETQVVEVEVEAVVVGEGEAEAEAEAVEVGFGVPLPLPPSRHVALQTRSDPVNSTQAVDFSIEEMD